MSDESAQADSRCIRCGYDLRGIADEHLCPECGLLAGRSRNNSDHIREARPAWLGKISVGLVLLLCSLLVTCIWMPWGDSVAGWLLSIKATNTINLQYLAYRDVIVYETAALIFYAGTFLITSAEGYPPRDRASRRWRIAIRIAAGLPAIVVAAMLLNGFNLRINGAFRVLPVPKALLLLAVPIFLVAIHVRMLARRARMISLATQCTVSGFAAAGALIDLAIYLWITSARTTWLVTVLSFPPVVDLILACATILAIIAFCCSFHVLFRLTLCFQRSIRETREFWQIEDKANEVHT